MSHFTSPRYRPKGTLSMERCCRRLHHRPRAIRCREHHHHHCWFKGIARWVRSPPAVSLPPPIPYGYSPPNPYGYVPVDNHSAALAFFPSLLWSIVIVLCFIHH
ncbi:hypothetical protein NL676_027623 [Syzygium grande]|nr:hypothetical protein NL676_027623 [Syzygium grande]